MIMQSTIHKKTVMLCIEPISQLKDILVRILNVTDLC